MPCPTRLTAALLAAALLATAASAQTPQATTQHTQPPSPTGISAWPTPQSLKPGTRLLITTTSPFTGPYPCSLDYLDADHIACGSSHHQPPIVYDRGVITIVERGTTHTPSLHLSSPFFVTSASLLFFGVICTGVTGSTPCAVLALAGLFAIVVGGAVDLVSTTIDIYRLHQPTTIYIAPPPVHH